MENFKEIIHTAVKLEASDMHMTVGMPPIYRVDGELVNASEQILEERDIISVVRMLTNEHQMEELESNGEVDFAVTYDGNIRMRCNAFHQQGRTALVLRILPMTIPTMESMELGPIFVEQAEKPRGLVVLTGPTGSGKSSTLAAMLDYINHTRRKHIITLENPIEFVYTPDKCIINQREVGQDTRSFSDGLKSILREDPDVILIGEMRSLDTIETALIAAETGHLVFATLHTNSAADTVDRIVDAFHAEQQAQIRMQLSMCLQAVVSQQLLPHVSGRGRVMATEVMTVTPAIRNLIREGKTPQIANAITTTGAEGNHLMDSSLITLFKQHKISSDVAIKHAHDPDYVRRHTLF